MRYFLAQDYERRWYVVPLAQKEQWEAWKENNFPPDCLFAERLWQSGAMIEYADRLTFENPKLAGENDV